jgi:hypothetical protein
MNISEISPDYKGRIEVLKNAAPGMTVCVTRHAICEFGGGTFEGARRALTLDFSHAWILDFRTGNIIVVRLPDSAEETIGMFKTSIEGPSCAR